MQNITAERKKYNNLSVKEWAFYIMLALSCSPLSLHLIVRYSSLNVILTMILAPIFFLLLLLKTGRKELHNMLESAGRSLFILLLAVILTLEMYKNKGVDTLGEEYTSLVANLFCIEWWLLSIPALFYLLYWLSHKIEIFLKSFWSSLNLTEKRIYIGLSAISVLLILVLYMSNSHWYESFDQVYSIDSGFVKERIFKSLSYYDIRHPILSIFSFPVWALLNFFLNIVAPSQLVDVMTFSLLQALNVQLLLLTAFMLGKLAANKWITLIYLVSSPVMLFTIFLEKYQFCSFLLVLYVFQMTHLKKSADVALLSATAAMPTNIFIFTYELVRDKPVQMKLFRLGQLLLRGVAFLVCAGRVHLLNPLTLWSEISSMAGWFGFQDLTLPESLSSFGKMVQGSFVSLSSEIVGGSYLWSNILHSISFVEISIVLIIVLGIVVSRKDEFAKLCTIWTVAGFVLFVIAQWSAHESPLFSILFSWALIPLFVRGVSFLLNKLWLSERYVYPILAIVLFVINLLTLIDISLFFGTLN